MKILENKTFETLEVGDVIELMLIGELTSSMVISKIINISSSGKYMLEDIFIVSIDLETEDNWTWRPEFDYHIKFSKYLYSQKRDIDIIKEIYPEYFI